MKIFTRDNDHFTLIVLAFSVYAALFIYRTSFLINEERYFSLFDDAMISMRYAKNLANGYGLVWNPGGERVEGYTNPLWVLYMSLFHLLPIAKSKISLSIQLTGALLLAINLYYVRKIAQLISGGCVATCTASVVLTAFYLPINKWSLQGMEVGLVTLIMTVSLWQALRCTDKHQFCPSLYILLGLGTLVRPDMVIPFLAIGIFIVIADTNNRRKNLILGSFTLLLFVLAQTIFRTWYYGDVFPNTYYLKLTGYPFPLRLSRGLYVLLNFMYRMNWIPFVVTYGILLFRRDKLLYLLSWMFLCQVMYSVYVGGDAWEHWGGSNRYLCIVMPSFFILFSFSLSRLVRILNKMLDERAEIKRGLGGHGLKYIFPLLLACSLLNFNSVYGPGALAEFLLIKPPHPTEKNKEMVERALLLSQFTKPRAKIAVVWSGAMTYFSDRSCIDLLGKNDKRIAREVGRMESGLRRFIGFWPGHNKWNYSYSIGQLKPDVITQLWKRGQSPEEIKPFLDDYYTPVRVKGYLFYVRNGSREVRWERMGWGKVREE